MGDKSAEQVGQEILEIASRAALRYWPSHSDRSGLEDRVSEITSKYLKAYRKSEHSEIERAALIFAIAKNLAIDHSRKIRPEKTNSKIEKNPAVQDCMLSNELRSHLETALTNAAARLTSRERAILYLRTNSDMSWEDCAKILDISTSKARRLFDKSVRTLRQYMNDRVKKDIQLQMALTQMLAR